MRSCKNSRPRSGVMADVALLAGTVLPHYHGDKTGPSGISTTERFPAGSPGNSDCFMLPNCASMERGDGSGVSARVEIGAGCQCQQEENEEMATKIEQA